MHMDTVVDINTRLCGVWHIGNHVSFNVGFSFI